MSDWANKCVDGWEIFVEESEMRGEIDFSLLNPNPTRVLDDKSRYLSIPPATPTHRVIHNFAIVQVHVQTCLLTEI